ncbi:metalloregulator ArsR/SmtB family transcription factor [Sphaerisporangium sp. NPDC088356]|uniref:ArsR/SmtB family transcription factor n=1 Tax=Sphaerisporangium sp. NPDC088356 TaxID=3154871 RepID=UPI003415C4BE
MSGKIGRPRLAQDRPDAFTALADLTRRHLLQRLTAGECSVSELMADLAITQAAVSQHLKVLRDAGLVEVRPAGRHRLYRLRPEGLAEPREWLAELERFWKQRLKTLGTVLDEIDAGPEPGGPAALAPATDPKGQTL